MAELGVISDTHGLLRPEAVAALEGVEQIVHLGDIGPPEILDQLRALAPLMVVRGNVDVAPWTRNLPETATVHWAGKKLLLIHDLERLPLDPGASGFAAVLYGHTHQPKETWNDGVLYFNPGSAGPRRFRLPITLARLSLEGDTLKARLVPLATDAA
jgi:putative phosphoesterase